MKVVLISLLGLVFITLGCLAVVRWANKTFEHSAEVDCTKLGAEPIYTGHISYICITPDGRFVGRSSSQEKHGL